MHLVVPPGGSFREPRRIELGARVLTIGRSEACDVRVDVPGVDDEHAKISELALVAVGPDCAVGDVPLDAGQRRLVMPGDEIQIGSVVLALDGSNPGAPVVASGPRVIVVEGQNSGAELVLASENREYVIGRNPKADLVLEDREVSREHIKVVRRGLSVFIFDAASTRGSWLGRSAVYQGTRVEWQRPRMLKLGATVLSLDLPIDPRGRGVQVSAPMTPPPRAPRPGVERALPSSPPSAVDASASEPPPANIVAYHYEAKPQSPAAPSPGPGPVTMAGASLPPPATASHPNLRASRTAWKKTSPTIGRASGILLLALAGLAILGVLFVVFSIME